MPLSARKEEIPTMNRVCALALLGKRVLSTSTMILLTAAIASFAWPGMAAAESEEAGTELQNYFSNANTTGGQAFVNITAPLEGNLTATDPTVREGETCAMIYVFNDAQAMQACCGCPVTADGLLTLNVTTQLANSPAATQTLLHDGTIRILSALPNATVPTTTIPSGWGCDLTTGVCCDPTAASTGFTLTPGNELVAWATHIQNTQVTEDEFQADVPDSEELNNGLPGACADVTALGSGQGVCTCIFVPPTPTATATATPTATATATATATTTATPLLRVIRTATPTTVRATPAPVPYMDPAPSERRLSGGG